MGAPRWARPLPRTPAPPAPTGAAGAADAPQPAAPHAGRRGEPEEHGQAPAAPSVLEDAAASAPAPFVGREAELERLRAALGRTLSGAGQLVLVAGEAGIGKTRLTQRLADEARARGGAVLWGRCWEGEGAPAFWPWSEALGAYARVQEPEALRAALGPVAAYLAPLVPQLSAALPDLPAPEPAEPEQARFRLFDAVTAFLQTIAAQRPLLLVLDDLHWADKPSLLLLQYLVRACASTPLLIVCTYRDSDLDRDTPLSGALAALHREPSCERLALSGLSLAEAVALVAAAAGHALDASGRALAERLWQETEGNPFFIGETLRLLVQSGRLRERDGRWTLTAPSIADLGIPEGVRQVIGQRLARLTGETQRLLALAAVIGREFDAALLEQAGALNGEAVDAALEEAETARLIEEAGRGTGRYRFAHALIRETLVAELPSRRRVRLHRQVGEALETAYAARPQRQAAALAHHFAEAGAREQALRYGRLAAEQAEAETAWEEAARHAERCLTLLGEMEAADEGGEDEAALLLLLGRCLRNAGEQRAAWRTLMRAIDAFRQRGDGAGQARATLEALEIWAPPLRLVALTRAALAALGDDEREPALAGRLLAALLSPYRTGPREAAEDRDLRARAEALASRHDLAEVAALLLLADVERARASGDAERVMVLHRQAHEALAAVHAGLAELPLYWAGQTLLMLGRLGEAEATFHEVLAYARARHLHFVQENIAAQLARIPLAHGDAAGFAALDEAYPAPGNWQWSAARAARWLWAGELARAVAALPEPALAAGVPEWLWFVHALRARVLWLAGDEAAARADWARLLELLPALLDTITSNGLLVNQRFLLAGEALLHLAEAPLLDALERHLHEREAAGGGVVFSALAADSCLRQRAMLQLWLGKLEAAEVGLRAALAWCERERCPVEAGRCHLGLAEVTARHERHAAAREHLDRAEALFDQYGARGYLDAARRQREEINLSPGPSPTRGGETMER